MLMRMTLTMACDDLGLRGQSGSVDPALGGERSDGAALRTSNQPSPCRFFPLQCSNRRLFKFLWTGHL